MFKKPILLLFMLLLTLTLSAKAMELTREEIQLRGFRSVPEAIASLPGVDIQSYYGNSALVTVSINGSKGSQVEVYIDGVRQVRDYDGSFNLGLVALSRVEKIIIDADKGIGGTIYIHTRKNASGEVSFSNNTLFDSNNKASTLDRIFNGQNVSAYYGGNAGSSSYSIGAAFNRDKTSHRITSSDDKTGVYDYSVDGSYGFSKDKISLGINGNFSLNDADTMGSTTYITNTNTKTLLGGANAFGNYKINDTYLLKLGLGWQFKGYKYKPYVYSAYDPESSTDTNVFSFDIKGEREKDKLDLSLGLAGSFTIVDSSSIGNKNRLNIGILADLSYKISEAFDFSLDMRAPLSSTSDGFVNGVFVWHADAKTHTDLSLKAGFSLVQPNLSALYWPADYSMYFKGNPNLKPEKAFSASILIESAPTKNISYSGSIFVRHTTDLLAYVYDSSTYMYSYDNIDKALFIGSNQSIKTIINNCILLDGTAMINYTYNLSGDNSITDQVRVNNVRMHTLKLTSGYVSKTINALIDIQFLGGYYYNNVKQHANTLYGITITYNPMELISLSARLDNIFNESYFIYEGYPMPGTNLTLKCSIKF